MKLLSLSVAIILVLTGFMMLYFTEGESGNGVFVLGLAIMVVTGVAGVLLDKSSSFEHLGRGYKVMALSFLIFFSGVFSGFFVSESTFPYFLIYIGMTGMAVGIIMVGFTLGGGRWR